MVYETDYLNLNPKKEKSVAFQSETQIPAIKPSEDDDPYQYVDNSLALIAKNYQHIEDVEKEEF